MIARAARGWLVSAALVAACLASPARAGDVQYLAGGCGSANIGLYGNPYLTVDSAGRNCIGLYYAYSNISSNATTVVKSTPGVLHSITINTKGASSNVAAVYDGTAAAGVTIGTIDTTSNVQTLIYDVAFGTNLTIVTSTGTAANITVSYK